MRKNLDLERFPQSAVLFRFCFDVFQLRQGQMAKVHDQNIGDLLEYNPSDTSHWKRGKKAIRSIHALSSLAEKLQVDLDIVEGLASGELDFEEAWFEFLENEELQKVLSLFSAEASRERRDRRRVFDQLAQTILNQANITSIPVYLPEVLALFPFIQVSQGDISERLVRTARTKPGHYAIRYRKGELRAHTRAALAREIARVLLHLEPHAYIFPERKETFHFLDVVDLSNALLVPSNLLRAELQKISLKANVLKTLSEAFWVPKNVVRSRLADLLLENARFDTFAMSDRSSSSFVHAHPDNRTEIYGH